MTKKLLKNSKRNLTLITLSISIILLSACSNAKLGQNEASGDFSESQSLQEETQQANNDSIIADTEVRELLWEEDGWSYYLEHWAQEDAESEDYVNLSGSFPIEWLYKIVREKGNAIEELDKLVYCDDNFENFSILPTKDRIIFMGFNSYYLGDIKQPQYISMNKDGTGRVTADIKLDVAKNLCYDGEYLYYEGFAKDKASKRPVNRMTVDFSENLNMTDIDGKFLTVHNGYAYFIHNEGNIYSQKLDWSSEAVLYDKIGFCSDDYYDSVVMKESENLCKAILYALGGKEPIATISFNMNADTH